MSTQPFGAAPPPETPAPEPDAAPERSPLLLFGAPALAALLVAGGLAYVLLGGSSDDGLATGVPPGAPAPADPTPSPSPSTEAPRTLPQSVSRNPFDPLVREPASGSGVAGISSPTGGGTTGALAPAAGGSTAVVGTGSTIVSRPGYSTGPGPGPGAGTGTAPGKAPGTGTAPGKAPGTSTGGAPGAATGPSVPVASSLDAAATCKAGDDLWTTYYTAMEQDRTITHTMAGNAIGPVTSSIDTLATTTGVEDLRQPLRTWARASASVRTQLVSGTAVRDIEPADPLRDASGGAPKPGVRPVVDQSSVLLARTAVRERCYQLTDPLVEKDSL